MQRGVFSRVLLAGACGTGLALAAGADDVTGKETVGGLVYDPVTVTAIGSKQRLFESPYTAHVVPKQQIDERQYRTLPQALRDVPGVFVQETSVGQGSPYIRGFTGFQNLFLIDGIRLNNSVFRDGPNQYWNTVDARMIQQIEIVKGPSSTLYGSDAIGGTVNALSISPYTYGEGTQFGGRVLWRGSTAESSHTTRGELSVTHGDTLGAVAGITYRDFGDLDTGGGTQGNTGYREWNNDFKLEHFLEDNVRLVLAHQLTIQNNVPRTHSTTAALPFRGTSVGSDIQRDLDQRRELVYLQLHAEELQGPVRELHASLSWHNQEETQDRIRSNMTRNVDRIDVHTLGLFVYAVSDTSLGELTYGLDYYRDWVDSSSNTNPIQGPVADDASYDLLGLFVQNRMPLSDSFEVIAGVRFTYARAAADRVDINDVQRSFSEDWVNVAGNLRFVWFIDEARNWNLFGGVSQGFRAPNLSDLTRDSDFSGGLGTETPSLDLDPEQYIMVELGAKARYERFTFQIAAFHYFIEDQILRVPTGMGVEFNKINSDDGFIQGIELGFAVKVSGEVTVFGNASWLDGEVQSVTSGGMIFDDYPSRLAPLNGQLGVRYEPNDTPFWIEGQVVAAADADKLSLRDQGDSQRIPSDGTPGYVVASLRGGVDVHDQVTVTLSVENITDENYRVHGSGQNMPGINVILGVEARF